MKGIASVKSSLRRMVRAVGFDLVRYHPMQSDTARVQRLLLHHGVDLVLDIGANMGQFAAFLRNVGYRGKIVSFEPLLDAHDILLSASKGDRHWEIAPRMAIGELDGETKINVSNNSFSSSILPMLDMHRKLAPQSQYTDTESVPLRRLDTVGTPYVQQGAKCVFLKIDVQGYEARVLEGAARILPLITCIQLELSLVALYEGEILFREMIDTLDSFGYDLHTCMPAFTDDASGRLLQVDGIFVRRSALESIES